MNGIETAFIARVGSEPELKTSSAGKPWTSFNVCVAEGDEAQWVKVVAFGERAEQLAGSLKKGDKVYAEGRLKLESWTGKDGQQRSGIKVAAWKVERLGEIGKNKPAKPPAVQEGANAAPAASNQPTAKNWQDAAADEIPF